MGRPDLNRVRLNRDRKNTQTASCQAKDETPTQAKEAQEAPEAGSTKNKDSQQLSQRFDILYKRKVGSLVVAQLNVQKIG